LNLSLGGLGVSRKLLRLEWDGFEFGPDAVLFALNSFDRVLELEFFARQIKNDRDLPYDYLNELVKLARVDGHPSNLVIKHRLKPYVPKVFDWAFARLADQCAERGIRAFLVYRPAPNNSPEVEATARAELFRAAAQAGLEVLDLSPAFDDVQDRTTLVLAPWDDHTSALGHRLLADELFEQLKPKLSSRAAVNASPTGPPAGH
jgi:hypothetical protein